MDYAIIGLAAICVVACLVSLKGLLALADANQRLLDLIGEQRREAQDERREIINRVQFPERMPTRATGKPMVQDRLTPEQRREIAQVGRAAPQVATDGD
jgi:hypothetical protein